MEESLISLLEELINIKKYLIKKGKSRYKGSVIKNKLFECENIIKRKDETLNFLYKSKDIKFSDSLSSVIESINATYKDILNLCTKYNSDSNSDSESSSHSTSIKMEFDLKTACNLIKVVEGDQQTINSIIDSIEMYSDMLSPSGQKLLIKFILKSRLTQSAKLRMLSDYNSMNDLIKDLKTNLLTKKSATAIQSKLQSIYQGHRSIEQYGSEIEKLFSDLTITQADGNPENYTVLKPINEKLAVKRFSDGLRNTRLSTIIAARNYDHLKDAIQAAKDEELNAASSSKAEEVMQFSHRGRGKPPRPYNYNNHSRGNYNFRGHRGKPNLNNYWGYNNSFSRGYYNNFRGRPPRGPASQSNRGRGRVTQGRGYYRGNNRANIHFAQETHDGENHNSEVQNNTHQFFRT